MASIWNVKGTHFESFFIKKGGPTIYQGVTVPSNSEGKDGDLYIQFSTTNEEFYQKRVGVWVPVGASSSSTSVTVATTSPIGLNPGDDVTIVNLTSPGPASVVLPANPPVGTEFIVKDGKGDAETNNITITVSGSGTMDGDTSQVINIDYEAYRFIYNGTEYNII